MKKLYHYPAMTVLSILTAFTLIIFEICFFVTQVLLKPSIYSEALADSGVSSTIYNDLETYFTQYSAPTGIPSEVFLDPLSEDELYSAAYTLLIDSIEYLSDENAAEPQITYDYTALEESITSYVETYSEENDIEKDDEYYELIDSTISTAESQIESRLDVMMMYTLATSSYASTFHKYSGVLSMAMIGSAVMTLVFFGVMIFIDRRHPRDYTYWAGSILFCSSVIFLVPCCYLDKIGYFNSFVIKTGYIYDTVTGLCNEILDRVINAQIIVLLIGILLILLTVVFYQAYRKYLKHKSREEIRA